jgi:hypothetical protein
MTKAYLTPPKAIRLPSGGRMRLGMIIGGEPIMQNPQRPLNSALNIARDGAPKRVVEAQTVPGQKRQTKGEPHPYHHGVSIDDTPNLPIKAHTKSIPVHSGMTEAQKAKLHPIANDPSEILRDASNLGRKPEKC